MTPYAEIAVSFASALVDGDFARAQLLLTLTLRRQLPQKVLREKLYAMFRGFAEGDQPRKIHFDKEFQKDEWPDKAAGDVGWAYVGILGDEFVEAVSVVVVDVEGKLLIREIEWGRP